MSYSRGHDLPDWDDWLALVDLKFKDDGDVPGEHYYPCIRRSDKEPMLSPEEEYDLMVEEVERTQGFDIDFSKFRCIFNYRPIDFDKNSEARPETTRELMDRVSRSTLADYNDKHKTKYEFVEAVKANYYIAGGLIYFLTFKGKLPYDDDDSKVFQAKVRHAGGLYYLACDIKSEKNVHSIEAAVKEDPKKPRLTSSD